MRRFPRVYTIGVEFKKSDTTTSVVVSESEHQIRCEHDIDNNCKHLRISRSQGVIMLTKGPRESKQGCQFMDNELQTSQIPTSSPLLVSLRGGGTPEEADEEHHPRYIASRSLRIKCRRMSDDFSSPCESPLAATFLHSSGLHASSESDPSPHTASLPHPAFSLSSPYASSSISPTYVSPNATNHCLSRDVPETSSASKTIVKRLDRDLQTDL